MNEFLNKAAQKCGFTRERFVEENIPTDNSRICVMPFFGDLRSLFILSSLLLNKFRNEEKGSKYFILCSWKGCENIFPWVNEFWGLNDNDGLYSRMYSKTSSFDNTSEEMLKIYRNLNTYFFEDLIIPKDEFKNVYNFGIENEYWTRYKKIRKNFPEINSSAILGKNFNHDLINKPGYKLFIYPSIYMQSFKNNSIINFKVNKDFWIFLIDKIQKLNIVPIVYKNSFTYDLSEEEKLSNCIFYKDDNIKNMLSVMRSSGCVLDIFNGISRFAIMARCPFIRIDERNRYIKYKEYEIDDLFALNLTRKYIFSFTNIIENGNHELWETNLLETLVNTIGDFLPIINKDTLPSVKECNEIISYDFVRKKNLKKMGVKFFKLPKKI